MKMTTRDHVLVLPAGFDVATNLRDSALLFPTPSLVFEHLQEPKDDRVGSTGVVCSCSDGPSVPLSDRLHIVGFAPQELPLIRKIICPTEAPDFHRCTLRACRHQRHQSVLRNVLRRLRHERLVAVSAIDKNQQFGVLVAPTDASNQTEVRCHMGNVADAFYSDLDRGLDTRSESRIFHARVFNNWVKAMQIEEVKRGQKGMRVLDLGCGKGRDLGKWMRRGIATYVGIDVAKGSLVEAAVDCRRMRESKTLKRCTFVQADLGCQVPGRTSNPDNPQTQHLSSWSLHREPRHYHGTPKFEILPGGGISSSDKFHAVSIQFAIHYMMSTRARARRFFQTVSNLLEAGGNLIVTTIDSRVVLKRLMELGFNHHNNDFDDAVVVAGDGLCRLLFKRDVVKRLLQARDIKKGTFDAEAVFGLQYSFTLKDGSGERAGVGDAVNAPEWLAPIPVLEKLANEAGLVLESGENFHEFYSKRKNEATHPSAYRKLYKMKVLDRNGSIPSDNWDICRMYVALKFRKQHERRQGVAPVPKAVDTRAEDSAGAPQGNMKRAPNGNTATAGDPPVAKRVKPSALAAKTKALNPKLYLLALRQAKATIKGGQWDQLEKFEQHRLVQQAMEKLSKTS